MGYTASVGAMILDEMATVNEQAENRMDALNTALVVAEDKITAGQEWSERHVRAVREMEVDVGGLLASTAFLRGEHDRMRREMDGLLQLNIRMHEVIMELRAAVRCQGHSHPKLSVAQGAGSKSSADNKQPTARRPMTTGNTPVWFPGH